MKHVRSDEHRHHFPDGELSGGVLVRPFECPERWDYIVAALDGAGLIDVVDPLPLDQARVAEVHDPRFVEFLATAWDQWTAAGYTEHALPTVYPARGMAQVEPDHIDGKLGYYSFALETAITPGTWRAASASAAIAQTAQKLVTGGERSAFALCRPPGHHAAADLYGGYCFLNNAAIAANGFLADGAERVAILDVDFHHGNGTQSIFYDRADVLFCSLHGDPIHEFPHFLGFADETGRGPGEGFNANYPLAPGTPFDRWAEALDNACRRITDFAPDALVVSLGVDTFEADPISSFKLTSDDFSTYGETIGRLQLPTVYVMEGGYAVEQIGVNTANVLVGHLQTQR
jgi:acetoin utilization deacetylase AcuC-like enzyme